MATRRTSPAAQAMIVGARDRGTAITGSQIERWTTLRRTGPRTILKLAPDLQTPLTDRTIDYYCELARRVKIGSKGSHGVIVGMAYAGYHDLVDDVSFRADLLVSYMSGVPEDSTPDDVRTVEDTFTRTIDNIRPGRNPVASQVQSEVVKIPTGEARDFTTVAIHESANILTGGVPDADSITNMVETHLVAAGATPLNTVERTVVETSMSKLSRERARRIIMTARIADLVFVARVFNGVLLMGAAPTPDTEEFLMVTAANALTSGLTQVTLQQIADDLGISVDS